MNVRAETGSLGAGDSTLITGASSGIGEALAHQMAEALAGTASTLVLMARRRGRLEQLQKELSGRHALDVVSIDVDLDSRDGVGVLLDALERCGLVVRTLINNAGSGFEATSTTFPGRLLAGYCS